MKRAFVFAVWLAVAQVAAEQPPQRVVSLVPALTEMVFAIGAGEKVIAVSEKFVVEAESPGTAPHGRIADYAGEAWAEAGRGADAASRRMERIRAIRFMSISDEQRYGFETRSNLHPRRGADNGGCNRRVTLP